MRAMFFFISSHGVDRTTEETDYRTVILVTESKVHIRLRRKGCIAYSLFISSIAEGHNVTGHCRVFVRNGLLRCERLTVLSDMTWSFDGRSIVIRRLYYRGMLFPPMLLHEGRVLRTAQGLRVQAICVSEV